MPAGRPQELHSMLRVAGSVLLAFSSNVPFSRTSITWGRVASFHATTAALEQPSRVLFLGTPQAAADVLKLLVQASTEHNFTVCGVVTKPGGASDNAKDSNVQVQRAARKLGLPPHSILTPASPKEPEFLEAVSKLSPDLCITAAYGGMLPQRFLDIPRLGTLNIHPSLLPKYRGAAPVQRALQAGEQEIGVSVVYTVLKCDAGPILEQTRVQLLGDEQAPELTCQLFKVGAHLLLGRMGDVLSGRARAMAVQQDEQQATHAAKVTVEEAALDPRLSAHQLHNQVRAMAGWPGSYVDLLLHDRKAETSRPLQIHVLKTRVVQLDNLSASFRQRLLMNPVWFGKRVQYGDDSMLLPCGDRTLLELLQVKPRVFKPGRPIVVSGQEYMRKLGRHQRLLLPQQGSGQEAAGQPESDWLY